VICLKCHSEAIAVLPAEIRLYRNKPRSLSHPPISPHPDVQVCLDCGWSAFSIPHSWFSEDCLRSIRAQIGPEQVGAIRSKAS
jgi:hypothetical protein